MKNYSGNPSVLGLSALSLSTLLMQFYNLGLCTTGPVLVTAIIFGGCVQILAGINCFKVNDIFGYNLFVSYGAFWMSLGGLWFLNATGTIKINPTDMGAFFICWTLFTLIMWPVAIKVNTATALLHTFLLFGMIALVCVTYGLESFVPYSVILFTCAAIGGWYIMLSSLLHEVGHVGFPLGPKWSKKKVAALPQFNRVVIPKVKPVQPNVTLNN